MANAHFGRGDSSNPYYSTILVALPITFECRKLFIMLTREGQKNDKFVLYYATVVGCLVRKF